MQQNFNSHTPHGVRHIGKLALLSLDIFQLTHPTRGATWKPSNYDRISFISTHTPHTGCDCDFRLPYQQSYYFNSHTPHGVRLFISTGFIIRTDFNSHTPHGVRPERNTMPTAFPLFQLTHPTRGATDIFAVCQAAVKFQLTHPTRGATFSER